MHHGIEMLTRQRHRNILNTLTIFDYANHTKVSRADIQKNRVFNTHRQNAIKPWHQISPHAKPSPPYNPRFNSLAVNIQHKP